MRNFNEYLNKSLEDEKFAETYQEIKAETDLSIALTQRREDLNLTQQQLADLTGIKQPMLARIEKGQIPKPATLQKLAGALRVGIVFTGDKVSVIEANRIALGDLMGELIGIFVREEAKIPLSNVVSIDEFKAKRKAAPLTIRDLKMESYENVKSAIG